MSIMNPTSITPSTSKVRRDVVGGKRGAGNAGIARIRRRDLRKITYEATNARLTSRAGLVAFGAFARELGLDRELARELGHMKADCRVVYPMGAQLRLLIDAQVAGESRVLGVEALAADPLFAHASGGSVPSIDTLYRDLERFDSADIATLERLMVKHGLEGHGIEKHLDLHLDIDPTVEPVFGAHEGATVGYNPRYHGRASYQPIVTRLAETGSCVGAVLRRGDQQLGAADAPKLREIISRVRARLRRGQQLFVRMDAGADCGAILAAIEQAGAFYVVKARVTVDLAVWTAADVSWRTIDRDDVDGTPLTQIAEIPFTRLAWAQAGVRPRVIAVRTVEPRSGRQLMLWEDAEWTTKIYLTNSTEPAEDAAARYEGRAGIEAQIAEWKNGWGIGEIPCWGFHANHAMLLLKLLAHNLVRRFVRALAPELIAWRIEWIRHALVCVAGQLVRSGRQWTLRVLAASRLLRLRQRE